MTVFLVQNEEDWVYCACVSRELAQEVIQSLEERYPLSSGEWWVCPTRVWEMNQLDAWTSLGRLYPNERV